MRNNDKSNQLLPYFLLSIKEKYIGGKLIYSYRNSKNKETNRTTTITDIIIKKDPSATCLTVMGEGFIYGFTLPDLHIYKIDNHLVMRSSIKEIECCIYEKMTEKYLSAKTIMEKTIKLLKSKCDSWLGQEGEVARQNFKDGIGWSIDTVKTINAEFLEGQK